MKRELEKVMVAVVVGAIMLVVGFMTGVKNNKVEKIVEIPVEKVVEKTENVEIEYVWYQDGDVQELDGFYLEDGDTLVVLTDESYVLMNRKNALYSFQPVDLGDWNYEVENEYQLENIIKTYLSMKNTGLY